MTRPTYLSSANFRRLCKLKYASHPCPLQDFCVRGFVFFPDLTELFDSQFDCGEGRIHFRGVGKCSRSHMHIMKYVLVSQCCGLIFW